MEAQLTITSYSFTCEHETVCRWCVNPKSVYVSPSGTQHHVLVDGDEWSFPTLTRIVTQEEIMDYTEDGYPIGTGEYRDVVGYVDGETGKEVRPSMVPRLEEIQGVQGVEGEFAATGPIELGEKQQFEDCEFPTGLNPLKGSFRATSLCQYGDDGPYSGSFLSAGPVEILGQQAETALTQ